MIMIIVKTKDGYEKVVDRWELSTVGVVIDGSEYSPEMVEELQEVEDTDVRFSL